MNLTPRMWAYAVIAAVALAVTFFFNVRFMMAAGPHAGVGAFIAGGFANDAASSLTSDLTAGSMAFLIWMVAEARRLRMRHAWAYVVILFLVAFGVACPLFLLMRERRLRASGAT